MFHLDGELYPGGQVDCEDRWRLCRYDRGHCFCLLHIAVSYLILGIGAAP